jgi:eukaryotic-like serine/threonine-protein kinase
VSSPAARGRDGVARRRTQEPVESQTFVDRTLVVPRRPRGGGAWGEGPRGQTLVLGRYRLRERLGAGGFGVVWSAHDEQLQRAVAVKRVPLAPGEDAERVTREALASARLAHPAIVALYEACPVQDAFYLISELVDGDTLARLIADDALSDEQILRIGAALCSALAHAHERGVVHRDVKPHNVLIPHGAAELGDRAPGADARLGVAKLTDFGGARLSGEEVLTRTGDVMGTLAYMAPEQSEGRESGEPVDVYSLALVLYEALCGFNPVRGTTPAETARRIGRPIRSLARERRDLPRALTQTIDGCLHRAPALRGTLDELAVALERELDDDPSPRAAIVAPARRRARAQPTRLHDAPPPQRPRTATERGAAHGVAEQHRQAPPTSADADRAHVPAGADRALSPARPAVGDESWGLPRLVWLALALALAVWQTVAGRAGVGLFVLAALLPLVLVPVARRAQGGSAGWLTCALAPLLGVVALAGAFPAIAGQARRWRMRAAYAAVGYWWLALAEPLLSRRLWLGPASGTPSRAVWEGSPSATAAHVIAPLLSAGVLLGAAVWAGGAVLLPLIVRGRSASLDVVAATVWAGALALATGLAVAGAGAHGAHATPHGAIAGAALAAALAVGARALRGPV